MQTWGHYVNRDRRGAQALGRRFSGWGLGWPEHFPVFSWRSRTKITEIISDELHPECVFTHGQAFEAYSLLLPKNEVPYLPSKAPPSLAEAVQLPDVAWLVAELRLYANISQIIGGPAREALALIEQTECGRSESMPCASVPSE